VQTNQKGNRNRGKEVVEPRPC